MKTPKELKGLMKFTHRKGRMIQVQFRFEPGVWRSTGTEDELVAINIAEDMHRDITGSATNKRQTLREFAKGFYFPGRHRIRERLEKRNKNYTEEWFKLQQGRIDNFILPFFGHKLLSGTTTRMIDEWILDLKSTRGKPLSSSTQIKILNAFSAIMEEAVYQEIIRVNPLKNLMPITESNKRTEAFTRDGILMRFPKDNGELIRIWGELDWAVCFLIMIETGLRPGEVSALHWEDYYQDPQGFTVHRALKGRTRELKGLKTDNSGNRVKAAFISDRCATLLKKIRNDKLAGLVFTLTDQPLQIEATGKHFRISDVERKGRTQYCLRHTFTTLALTSVDLSNLPEEPVRDLMGHTGYRHEYDHRNGRDLLEKHVNVREFMF